MHSDSGMRYATAQCEKDKVPASLWPEKEIFRNLHADFQQHWQDLEADVAVKDGSHPIHHVMVRGLPRFGGGSHASLGNGHVHIAAVIGAEMPCSLHNESKIVRGGVQAQTYRCCQLMEQVLQSVNGKWSDVIRLTVYMPNLEETTLEDFRLAADFFFQERGCSAATIATTVVGCSHLWRSAAVQIEGTALCSSSLDQARLTKGTQVESPSQSPELAVPSQGVVNSVTTQLKLIEDLAPPDEPLLQFIRAKIYNKCDTVDVKQLDARLRIEDSLPADVGFGLLSNGSLPWQVAGQPNHVGKEPVNPCDGLRAVRRTWVGKSNPPFSEIGEALEGSHHQITRPVLEESLCLSTAQLLHYQKMHNPHFSEQTIQQQLQSLGPFNFQRPDFNNPQRAEALGIHDPGVQSQEGLRWIPLRAEQAQPLLGAIAMADASMPITTDVSRNFGQHHPLWEVPPLHNDRPSLRLQQLNIAQVGAIPFQSNHDVVWRVQTEAADILRTARVNPENVLCRRRSETGPGSTWSFTFDVALAHSVASFINIGLVEWGSSRKDNAAWPANPAETSLRLSQRRGDARVPSAASMGRLFAMNPLYGQSGQNATLCQMMLGCRKGVKWFGHSSPVPVLHDDVCVGSLLRFRCDYVFNAEGVPSEVVLWLLPSQVSFRKQGPRLVQLDTPLFRNHFEKGQNSVWVPAVTLHSLRDTVLLSWESGAS